MNISADFGMNQDFALAKILLVYSSGHRAFATLHEPKNSPDGEPPYLDEGRPVTMEFLKELGRQLGTSLPKEILPASVLVRTIDMLVWWTPGQKRLMFYGHASDGRTGRLFRCLRSCLRFPDRSCRCVPCLAQTDPLPISS